MLHGADCLQVVWQGSCGLFRGSNVPTLWKTFVKMFVEGTSQSSMCMCRQCLLCVSVCRVLSSLLAALFVG
jgi:hypothetical protein